MPYITLPSGLKFYENPTEAEAERFFDLMTSGISSFPSANHRAAVRRSQEESAQPPPQEEPPPSEEPA